MRRRVYQDGDKSRFSQIVKNIENIINLYQTSPTLFYPNSWELEKTMKEKYIALKEKQECLK